MNTTSELNVLKNDYSTLFVQNKAIVCCIDEATHHQVLDTCAQRGFRVEPLDLTQAPQARIMDASEWMDIAASHTDAPTSLVT